MKWAREYGELFQVQLGWNNWAFVCGEEAVKVITSPSFLPYPFICPVLARFLPPYPSSMCQPSSSIHDGDVLILGHQLTTGNPRQTILKNLIPSILPRSPRHRLRWSSHSLHVLF